MSNSSADNIRVAARHLAAGESLALLYGSAPTQAAEVPVEARNGCAVAITLPPAGVAVYG